MRRALTVIAVLAIAVAASGCRQIYAHRTRTITIRTSATGETQPFVSVQAAVVSGTATDWSDTRFEWLWQCAGAPATASDLAADCTAGGYNHLPQSTDGSFQFATYFMRHIETTRSGWVDCALTSCSVVVHASGPFYCDEIVDEARPGCWNDRQPGDAFEVYKAVPIAFLRTPEFASDCDVYTEVVDGLGQAFTSRAQCKDYVANLPAVRVTPSTGLHDAQTVRVVPEHLVSNRPFIYQCVGTPRTSYASPDRHCDRNDIVELYGDDTWLGYQDYTVSRYIDTPNDGVVDCAATACSIALIDGDGDYPYDYVVESTPITLAP